MLGKTPDRYMMVRKIILGTHRIEILNLIYMSKTPIIASALAPAVADPERVLAGLSVKACA